MNTNYDDCFESVIGSEGGYTTDRRDRGNWTGGVIGRGTLKGTKYGVSSMSYPNLDIKNLTLADAKAIYKQDFWDKAYCHKWPDGIDLLVFDAAINHGVSQSIRFLQKATGSAADGQPGPKTIAAVMRHTPIDVIQEFCVQRQIFYTHLSTWSVYNLGWTRRVMRTLKEAVEMTNPTLGPIQGKLPLDLPDPEPIVAPKEVPKDYVIKPLNTTPSAWWQWFIPKETK